MFLARAEARFAKTRILVASVAAWLGGCFDYRWVLNRTWEHDCNGTNLTIERHEKMDRIPVEDRTSQVVALFLNEMALSYGRMYVCSCLFHLKVRRFLSSFPDTRQYNSSLVSLGEEVTPPESKQVFSDVVGVGGSIG